ncbi:type II secretion system minor pseudopilin GspK [Craterilacuibacter sp.]|uniref:type II secretion system minor pseudopilin GspK n=1 Tax=Craterilacuibacter sp. TaxID=2870909 RepID=UPI003F330361
MKHGQEGMAVVMALLIVALATTVSALVLWQQGLWLRQVDTDRARAQTRLVADGGLAWAVEILRYDGETSSVDALSELWAQPLPKTDAQGVDVRGELSDAQGRFNLNGLVRGGAVLEPQLALYRRLLAELKLPDMLADTLADYLDADEDKRAAGAESADYLALRPPYRAANRPLQRAGQLAWVEGYTPEVMATLAAQVVALPETMPVAINVNTATPALMRALVQGVSAGELQGVINQRVDNHFIDEADFKARLPARAQLPEGVALATASQYFLLQSEVRQAAVRLSVAALIQRNTFTTRLVWREDGRVLSGTRVLSGATGPNTETP